MAIRSSERIDIMLDLDAHTLDNIQINLIYFSFFSFSNLNRTRTSLYIYFLNILIVEHNWIHAHSIGLRIDESKNFQLKKPIQNGHIRRKQAYICVCVTIDLYDIGYCSVGVWFLVELFNDLISKLTLCTYDDELYAKSHRTQILIHWLNWLWKKNWRRMKANALCWNTLPK